MKKKDFNYFTGKKYDGMMGRCYRETDISYKNYGGSGIRVCSSWIESLDSFRSWFRAELHKMNVSEEDFLKSPKDFTLDRIDPTAHYTPTNCRLVNMQVQARNKVKRKVKTIVSAEGERHEI